MEPVSWSHQVRCSCNYQVFLHVTCMINLRLKVMPVQNEKNLSIDMIKKSHLKFVFFKMTTMICDLDLCTHPEYSQDAYLYDQILGLHSKRFSRELMLTNGHIDTKTHTDGTNFIPWPLMWEGMKICLSWKRKIIIAW